MTGGMSLHIPQARQRAARNAAVAASGVIIENGAAGIVGAIFDRRVTRRLHLSMRLTRFASGSERARCIDYTAACIRMNGKIRSNQTAYSSRLASSALSYSAPRSLMASALARCAARNPWVTRTLRSNFFGLWIARSNSSAAWPHKAGAGGAASSGFNGTTDTVSLHDAPPGVVFVTEPKKAPTRKRVFHSEADNFAIFDRGLSDSRHSPAPVSPAVRIGVVNGPARPIPRLSRRATPFLSVSHHPCSIA